MPFNVINETAIQSLFGGKAELCGYPQIRSLLWTRNPDNAREYARCRGKRQNSWIATASDVFIDRVAPIVADLPGACTGGSRPRSAEGES